MKQWWFSPCPKTNSCDLCFPVFTDNFMHHRVSCSLMFPLNLDSPPGMLAHCGGHTVVSTLWWAGMPGVGKRLELTWGELVPQRHRPMGNLPSWLPTFTPRAATAHQSQPSPDTASKFFPIRLGQPPPLNLTGTIWLSCLIYYSNWKRKK